MSDLIRRDELLKRFSVNSNGDKIPEYDIDNFPVTITVKDVKEMIKKQPAVSEQEIRDKVIDEILARIERRLLGVHPNEMYEVYTPRGVVNICKDIAEQMKGETI